MNFYGPKLLVCITVINVTNLTVCGHLFTVFGGKKITDTPHKTAEANDVQECMLRCDLRNLMAISYEMTTRMCHCFDMITPFTDSPGWKAAFLNMVKSNCLYTILKTFLNIYSFA